VIHAAVGAITETDITFADASDAIVIGFNVRPEPKAKVLAEQTKVDMRLYRVIYKIIEDINAARVGMLKPTIEEQDTALIDVRELFKVPKVGTIAGCYVQDGEVSRNDQVRVVREGAIVFDGKIASLRRFKDDASSVKAGYECGIGIQDFGDVKEGDVIEAYRTVEVAREE
jgi:translation initiation factor IF-2